MSNLQFGSVPASIPLGMQDQSHRVCHLVVSVTIMDRLAACDGRYARLHRIPVEASIPATTAFWRYGVRSECRHRATPNFVISEARTSIMNASENAELPNQPNQPFYLIFEIAVIESQCVQQAVHGVSGRFTTGETVVFGSRQAMSGVRKIRRVPEPSMSRRSSDSREET